MKYNSEESTANSQVLAGEESPSPSPIFPPPPISETRHPLRLGSLQLTNVALLEEFSKICQEDPGAHIEALEAAAEMRSTPFDHLDTVKRPEQPNAEQGKVGRRAPPNPIASPWLGKYRRMQGEVKVQDPALRNNPLRGRLIVTISTSFILLFVFLQSIMLNYVETGSFIVDSSINAMYGPAPEILDNLGGLNTNAIRAGQTARIFWSMWMHAGWLHVLLNLSSQMQFLYMYEPDWGFWRSVVCFWISGVSGNILSAIIDPCTVTVGSSGALYGLMGSMIVYCVEYWKSIPRPWCILVFTLIVLIVSLLTGFTGNTDNFAHLGGLIGGTLFALGTLTSLTACEGCMDGVDIKSRFSLSYKLATRRQSALVFGGGGGGKNGYAVGDDGTKKKKVVKRGKIAHFGKEIKPSCKCGVPEWTVRIVAWAGLFSLWFCCFWYIFQAYEFQPGGHVTFSGRSECCCCYLNEPMEVGNWQCYLCAVSYAGGTWGEFCGDERGSARRLQDVENKLSQFAMNNPTYHTALHDATLRSLGLEDVGVSPAPHPWLFQQHSSDDLVQNNNNDDFGSQAFPFFGSSAAPTTTKQNIVTGSALFNTTSTNDTLEEMNLLLTEWTRSKADRNQLMMRLKTSPKNHGSSNVVVVVRH